MKKIVYKRTAYVFILALLLNLFNASNIFAKDININSIFEEVSLMILQADEESLQKASIDVKKNGDKKGAKDKKFSLLEVFKIASKDILTADAKLKEEAVKKAKEEQQKEAEEKAKKEVAQKVKTKKENNRKSTSSKNTQSSGKATDKPKNKRWVEPVYKTVYHEPETKKRKYFAYGTCQCGEVITGKDPVEIDRKWQAHRPKP